MKKKITLALLIVVATIGLTACTSTEVSSVGTTTTPVTTPVVTTVNTTTEATTTSEQLTTEPSSDVVTSDEQTGAVVSDETTTSEQKEVTTTTPEQLGSTTTSKKSTTTVGTTTKKPATVTTTTTKKATTTTTTTKKATTTTTTTTKKKTTTTTTTPKLTTTQEITTTTSPVIKITQSDVDKLVEELQEYSTNKHFEINEERVLSEIEEYKDVLPTGYDWEDYKNEVISAIPTFTPSNSSWNSPYSWAEYQNPENYSFSTYEIQLDYMKEKINWTYEWIPNCHIVIYAEYVVNEQTGYTGWDIYLLR